MPRGVLYKPGPDGHGIEAEWGDDAKSRAAAQATIARIYANKEGRVADMTQGQDGILLKAGEFNAETMTSLMIVPKLVGG